MKTVAIASVQDGVGKSRTTWDLLVALVDAGINSAAIEFGADGPLASINKTRIEKGNAAMPVFTAGSAADLPALLAARDRNFTELALLNTPQGGSLDEVLAIALAAELILIPTLPTAAAIAATASLVRPLARAGKSVRFLLVRTSKGGKNYDEELLASLGLTAEDARKMLVPTSIASRPSLVNGLDALGLGVLEAFGQASLNQEMVGLASQEIRQIRQFIRDELSI